MNLTIEQVRNLNILADFMDGLNDPKFTMSCFTRECDAPACALGWACTIPALRAAGLDSKVLLFDIGRHPGDMARNVFGEYLDLFASYLCRTIKTPQDWAAHCRAFLKANGYATTDHFKTFMDRVMVPVDTEQMEERERE